MKVWWLRREWLRHFLLGRAWIVVHITRDGVEQAGIQPLSRRQAFRLQELGNDDFDNRYAGHWVAYKMPWSGGNPWGRRKTNG